MFCYPQRSSADPLLYWYVLHNSLFLHLALFIFILCNSVLFCATPRNTEHHHSTFQVTVWCLYCFLLYCRGQDFSLHHCTTQSTRLYYSKMLNQLLFAFGDGIFVSVVMYCIFGEKYDGWHVESSSFMSMHWIWRSKLNTLTCCFKIVIAATPVPSEETIGVCGSMC